MKLQAHRSSSIASLIILLLPIDQLTRCMVSLLGTSRILVIGISTSPFLLLPDFPHEETNCRERERTPEERKEDEKFFLQFRHIWPIRLRNEQVPTGKLVLHITDGHGLRRSWTDRSDRHVEQFLNSFIVRLVRAAEIAKQDRIDTERRRKEQREQERRRHEEEQHQREEERKRQEEEEERCRQPEAQAAAWSRTEQIRAFAAAVRDAYLRKDGSISSGIELSASGWNRH